MIAEDLKRIRRKDAAKRLCFAVAAVVIMLALLLFLGSGAFRELPALKWLFWGACILIPIGVIRVLIIVNKGNPMKEIEKFCNDSHDPGAMMERLEKVWREGVNYGSFRLDAEYIIYASGMKTAVIPLKGAVLTYKEVDRASGAVFVILNVRYGDGQWNKHHMNEGEVNTILRHVMENCRNIAVGENKETNALWREKDMDGFRVYARNQRIGISAFCPAENPPNHSLRCR